MNIQDFAKLIKRKRKELDDMMRREMPVVAGRMAKDHFQDNFRKGGFVNNGLHPWPKAKRLSSGKSDAASNYGTLLSSRNHLFSSIKYTPSDYRVRVANEVPYAPIHNWGGVVEPKVTPQMRRFAWAMFYKSSGQSKRNRKGRKTAKKGPVEVSPEAEKWRALALTKKKKLKISIPQRQFLGRSEELVNSIQTEIETRAKRILNL